MKRDSETEDTKDHKPKRKFAKRQKTTLVKLLLTMKKGVEDELKPPVHEEVKHFSGDDGERAERETTVRSSLLLRNRAQEKLNAINSALKRLESDTYGICHDCEEPIDFDRLTARPMTHLCVDCKTAREQASARLGKPVSACEPC